MCSTANSRWIMIWTTVLQNYRQILLHNKIPTIFSITSYPVAGQEPIPADTGQEVGFTLDRPVHLLTCVSLDCGRKPGKLERTLSDMERTCKPHTVQYPNHGTTPAGWQVRTQNLLIMILCVPWSILILNPSAHTVWLREENLTMKKKKFSHNFSK